jgi:hypothetical protein
MDKVLAEISRKLTTILELALAKGLRADIQVDEIVAENAQEALRLVRELKGWASPQQIRNIAELARKAPTAKEQWEEDPIKEIITKVLSPSSCCASYGEPVPSSVSDRWVHPATPVGRVVCTSRGGKDDH